MIARVLWRLLWSLDPEHESRMRASQWATIAREWADADRELREWAARIEASQPWFVKLGRGFIPPANHKE